VTEPLLRDVKSQEPDAICEVVPTNVPRTLLVNPAAPPFDNPDLRRAMALTLDRKAFIDILTEGQGDVGGAMLPGPEGVWGMPAEMLKTLPGYNPDVAKNRAEARKIMEGLGYGHDKRLAVKVSVRNIAVAQDPAVILIDRLREIYIDGELETVDTTQWYPKVMRKDFSVGLVVSENGLDDADQQFYENYVCGAERNYGGYCNPRLDKLIDQQSMEADREKRRQLVWEIERKLAEGQCPTDHLSPPRGNLPATPGEGAHLDGQQHLQRLALRGPLARQINTRPRAAANWRGNDGKTTPVGKDRRGVGSCGVGLCSGSQPHTFANAQRQLADARYC
jgi:peptide/nickel transport system substrate-binding protein